MKKKKSVKKAVPKPKKKLGQKAGKKPKKEKLVAKEAEMAESTSDSEDILPDEPAKRGPKSANTMVKVTCPECEEDFEIDKNLYDAGDLVECPECHSILIVEVKGGRLCLASEKEKYFDDEIEEEEEEFEE